MSDFDLTPERLNLLESIRDKWLDIAVTPINFEEACEIIYPIHKELNRPRPEILYASSPFQACMLVSCLKDDQAKELTTAFSVAFGAASTKLKEAVAGIAKFQVSLNPDPQIEDLNLIDHKDALRAALLNLVVLGAQQAGLVEGFEAKVSKETSRIPKDFAPKTSTSQGLQELIKVELDAVLRRLDLPASLRREYIKLVLNPITFLICSALSTNLGESLSFEFWQRKAGLFEGAREAFGIEFNQDEYTKFQNLCKSLSWVFVYDCLCIVCERPTVIKYDDEARHSCEDGPVVAWADGYKAWAIGGVLLDEQIVMHPETLTLEQIRNEDNEEIRRICIERYGWTKYLEESNAKVLDVRMIKAEHNERPWMETLMYLESERMAVLCTCDPSTDRVYALEVDPSVTTCSAAQDCLLGKDHIESILGVELASTYPKLRT